MYAYQINNTNNPIELKELPIPKTKPNGVVIKILATPLLSYSEQYIRGELPYMMPPMPFTPGTNAVGIIHELGEGVQHFKVGQRVMVDSYWIKDEAVEEPAQALLGLTGISIDSGAMLEEYPHGTWREYADFPAALVHPLEGLEQYDAVNLSSLAKIVIPLGGLRRSGLQAGESVIINGATGYFGSAAVLGALALGAKVVATGRSEAGLQELKEVLSSYGERLQLVALQGDADSDIKALRDASGNGAHAALCMVGQAKEAHSTSVTLQSLKRNGRMVIMGSLLPDFSVNYTQMLLNNWEIKGNFMYNREDFNIAISLVKNGLIDLELIKANSFAYQDLKSALVAATQLRGLNTVVLKF